MVGDVDFYHRRNQRNRKDCDETEKAGANAVRWVGERRDIHRRCVDGYDLVPPDLRGNRLTSAASSTRR